MGAFFMPPVRVLPGPWLPAGGCGACPGTTSPFGPYRQTARDGSSGALGAAGKRRAWACARSGLSHAASSSCAFGDVGAASCWAGEAPSIPVHPAAGPGRTSCLGRDLESCRGPGVREGGQAARQQAGQERLLMLREMPKIPEARKQAKQKGRAFTGSPLVFCLWTGATGPERLPAGWARRVQGPQAGSARPGLPARVRQAARFPQARGCLPREQGPQLPGPGQPVQPERRLPAFPGPGRLQLEQRSQERQGPCLPSRERPQGPEPLQGLPCRQAFPVRSFQQQLRGPQERRFPQQWPERRGQRRSGAGRRRA